VDHDDDMVTIAITLSYRGSDFAGFARQDDQRSVQGELESALRTLSGSPVETVGAGRTDSGVHAANQVVSASIPRIMVEDIDRLMRSLNALTPADLVVRDVTMQNDGFSARFDARSRTYLYRIAQTGTPPLFMAPYSWYIAHKLDIEAMRQAATYLIGEHDFDSFCVAKSAQELHNNELSTKRHLDHIQIEPEVVMGEKMLSITIQGNAFLHSMVRVIVGTLVEVGLGKHDPSWIGEVLAARDRTEAGQTAPAQGLTLRDVTY